ncbi:MAG TPA: YfiR family protein, partial [Rhizomicrobium sp.]|nr:YfiR family protein [Rhizomicrobium sp.]
DRAARASGSGRPIAVRRLAAADAAEGCHMVFVANPNVAMERLRGRPVVTVTDSGMPERGIISFVMLDNHVRFDIDAAAAESNGIRISSKLLELAHSVTRRSGP